MAEAVNVGKLVITISGDTKELEAAAKRIGKSLGDVRKDTQAAARTAVSSFRDMAQSILPAVSAATAVAFAMRSFFAVIEQTTSLDNLSQSTGITVQRLAELRAMALQTGIQFETLSQALTQFGPRMTEALAQPASRGSQAMRALGIDVRDAQGNIRSLDQLLPDLADRFSRFADGSNKAALAAALFGEEARPRLVPLLNRGKAGLDELRKTLGVTITQEDIDRARDYQKIVGQLQLAFESFFREITRAAGPALIDILSKLSQYINKVNDAREANLRDSQMAQAARGAYDAQAEAVRQALAQLENLQSARSRLRPDRYAAEEERLNKILEAQREKLNELGDALALLRSNPLPVEPTPPAADRPQAPALDPLAIEKAQFALDQLMERMLGERLLLDEMNFAWATHADRVAAATEKINAVHEEGFRRHRAIEQAKAALARQEQAAILNTATAAASAIDAIWPQQKGAAIASAVINTAVAVTRALSSAPPPWNFAQAALVAAAGLAQIAQIRSTNKDGSGGGGGASTGGGTATPVAPEAANPGRAITIQGVDRAMWYSGAALEELIGAINVEVKNGATLISSGMRPT